MGREGSPHYPGEGSILVNLGAILERRGEIEGRGGSSILRASGQSPPPLPGPQESGGSGVPRGGTTPGPGPLREGGLQLEPRLGDDVYLKLGNIAYKGGGPGTGALLLWRRALELNPRNRGGPDQPGAVSSGSGGVKGMPVERMAPELWAARAALPGSSCFRGVWGSPGRRGPGEGSPSRCSRGCPCRRIWGSGCSRWIPGWPPPG